MPHSLTAVDEVDFIAAYIAGNYRIGTFFLFFFEVTIPVLTAIKNPLWCLFKESLLSFFFVCLIENNLTFSFKRHVWMDVLVFQPLILFTVSFIHLLSDRGEWTFVCGAQNVEKWQTQHERVLFTLSNPHTLLSTVFLRTVLQGRWSLSEMCRVEIIYLKPWPAALHFLSPQATVCSRFNSKRLLLWSLKLRRISLYGRSSAKWSE